MAYLLTKKSAKKYTWNDYLSWPNDERWEIIDGVAYNMTPAPSVKHQTLVGNLFSQLKQKLTNKPCRPFIAPVDVILTEHDIVQPDVFVVCDKAKITEDNIKGAPDLIVEVLSLSTALKDLREKKNLYERCGVKEYIIVDPLEEYIERFWLDADARYTKGEIFGPHEVFSYKSLEGVEINLWEIFEVERLKE
ncbi:MAG: hypothetical protein JETT_3543 [Candidatus Jettenia ecosi]|uniref:Putative restriction endonuclease domain-containing protein n=1 Tax=Candidatus Jettenia ecosi TaxID=2494326 RepID=A0A533QC44_9BACT|nr:MAG: hypothetical protein JETT_3543 [Candidatus Jettenia ecosi]